MRNSFQPPPRHELSEIHAVSVAPCRAGNLRPRSHGIAAGRAVRIPPNVTLKDRSQAKPSQACAARATGGQSFSAKRAPPNQRWKPEQVLIGLLYALRSRPTPQGYSLARRFDDPGPARWRAELGLLAPRNGAPLTLPRALRSAIIEAKHSGLVGRILRRSSRLIWDTFSVWQ